MVGYEFRPHDMFEKKKGQYFSPASLFASRSEGISYGASREISTRAYSPSVTRSSGIGRSTYLIIDSIGIEKAIESYERATAARRNTGIPYGSRPSTGSNGAGLVGGKRAAH